MEEKGIENVEDINEEALEELTGNGGEDNEQ